MIGLCTYHQLTDTGLCSEPCVAFLVSSVLSLGCCLWSLSCNDAWGFASYRQRSVCCNGGHLADHAKRLVSIEVFTVFEG